MQRKWIRTAGTMLISPYPYNAIGFTITIGRAVKLFSRNHCDPETVNSSGVPFYKLLAHRYGTSACANVLSYLESRDTVGSKALIPQCYITWNFGTNLRQELRYR